MSRDDPDRQAKVPYGGPQHRRVSVPPRRAGFVLDAADAAAVEGRTRFPSTVTHPSQSPRLLISGMNSRKVGRIVAKGRMRGFPIFTLTLEERATCPRTCAEWLSCYGNNMHWPRRHVAGRALEEMLWEELAEKQVKHPDGFLVRLHILGDFYSVDYAELWAEALEAYPALNVFGYTARAPDSAIGQVIAELLGSQPERWHIRFSGWGGATHGSVVVERAEDAEHLICPAQLGKTDCCATCALCWQTDRTIAFLRH